MTTSPRRTRRVLVVAYYFPPLGGIGSMRMASFARDLEQHGWEATVLAPRAGSYYRDEDLSFPEEKIIRTHSLEISRLAKRALNVSGDDVTPASPGRAGQRLRQLARACLYYPDAQIGWYPPALATGLRALGDNRFDLIFSTAYPMTGHLIARRLRRVAKVPWVAEYRDPFSDLVHPTGYNHRRAEKLERAIAREATEIVMTAPSWATRYGQRWGRTVEVITNGCDGPVAPDLPPPGLVLSHLGSMFPERQRLGGLWRALSTLVTDGDAPRLQFIGRLRSEVRAELEDNGLTAIVDESGFLPHAQAMVELARSTAVLLCGPAGDSPLLRGWIPAKTFEYLATDLPILYLGDTSSDVAAILKRYPGCHVIAPDDADAIVAALRTSRGQRYQRDITSITRPALAGELARVFDQALAADRKIVER